MTGAKKTGRRLPSRFVFGCFQKSFPKTTRCLLTEDLGTENIDFSILRFPGISWQTSLDTGLLEKGLSVPVVLDCHLRQQNATVKALLDVNTVFADFNLFNILNFLQWRED